MGYDVCLYFDWVVLGGCMAFGCVCWNTIKNTLDSITMPISVNNSVVVPREQGEEVAMATASGTVCPWKEHNPPRQPPCYQ